MLPGAPGDGVAVHLVPRPDGPAASTPPRVLKTSDAWFVIHHAFAHDVWRNDADAPEEAGGVVLYSTGWDEVSEGPFLADWGGRVPLYDKIPATFLFKVSIDLASGAYICGHGRARSCRRTAITR
jgi:hypothetical protein